MKWISGQSCVGLALLMVLGAVGFSVAATQDPPAADAPTLKLEWAKGQGVDELPYVEHVDVRRDGKELHVTLGGNLPDPGYKVKPVEAKLIGRLIVVYPRIERGSGFAAQVLKPFETAVRLEVPDRRGFTVAVVGRTGTQVKTLAEDR